MNKHEFTQTQAGGQLTNRDFATQFICTTCLRELTMDSMDF